MVRKKTVKEKSQKQEQRTAKQLDKIITSNGEVILVDAEDYPELSKYTWRIGTRGYATAKIQGTQVLMHRFILGLKEPTIQCDHIDHNPLNNRKSNLRICNQTLNNANRTKYKSKESIYKGVRPSGSKWRAIGTYKGTQYNLGSYNSEIEAGMAYNIFAKKYFGEFAILNNVPDDIIPKRIESSNPYKFINFNKSKNKWQVRITINGVRKQIATVKLLDDAIIAYNKFIIENELQKDFEIIEV